MKKPIYLYIELFMCCLTYSYIAILYSICQCTVPNLLSRKKKEERGRKRSVTHPMERIGLDRLRKGETGCLWERRRLQEAEQKVLSFDQCPYHHAASQPASWRGRSRRKEARFTGVGWDSVHCIETAGGPAENGGATNLHCWAGVQTGRAGKKRKKQQQREQKNRTGCWYMQTQWHRFGKG